MYLRSCMMCTCIYIYMNIYQPIDIYIYMSITYLQTLLQQFQDNFIIKNISVIYTFWRLK